MLDEIKKVEIYNDNNLRYLNISNVFFDHKLTNVEIAALKEMLFSINSINQIYFKGTIDLNSIEIIKYLLEISPMVNDKSIEKYILLDDMDFNSIMNMNFQNPDTWQISYKQSGNRYQMTSISKYKSMENTLNMIVEEINDTVSSPLEKIAFAYNYSKLFDFEKKNYSLPEIVEKRKGNSLGINQFFKEVLDKLEIKSYIGEVTNDGEKNYITIIDVNDSKYDIDGIYLFDPLSDSIPKELYENTEIRKINYNYFGLNLCDYQETIFNDKLVGILSCLIHDYEYDKEKLNLIDKKTKEELIASFDLSFESIHDRIKCSKLTDENRFKLIENIVDNEVWSKVGIDHHNLIKENYISRRDNIFDIDKNKILT